MLLMKLGKFTGLAAIFGLSVMSLSAMQPAFAEISMKQKAVLELFTSQGCSSCPPADKLLGELAERKDVIALTFPVDYWDYLGWKDTLAKPQYTRRQRDYARKRGDREVYTPQLVINGMAHAVGSRPYQIEAAIKSTRRRLKNSHVPVKMAVRGDTLVIKAAKAPEGSSLKSATLWLALATKSKSVSIRRGENGGRRITYYHVVRQLTPIGKWSGDDLVVKLPKKHVMTKGSDICTILLQRGEAGPIIGAAEIRN